jgi:hypothetical protein
VSGSQVRQNSRKAEEFGKRQGKKLRAENSGLRPPVGTKTKIQRIKFEDTRLWFSITSRVLDPKLPAQASAARIFDNMVERASREMMPNLA